MTAYNENIVKPCKMYYKGKEFTVGSLGLDPMYEAILYRFVKCRRRSGVVEGITYEELRSFTGIGEKKAHAIATALVQQGVEINDIPEIRDRVGVKLIRIDDDRVKCSACKGTLHIPYFDLFRYRFCPMCGKRFGEIVDKLDAK